MSFRLYKEGQGSWARGTLAILLGVTGLMSAMAVYDQLARTTWAPETVILGFVSMQVLVSALVLVPFGVAGVWLYNHQQLSDFLIETETELKTKVTWPGRKEALSNSWVVVACCFVLGAWIFFCDQVFAWISSGLY